jgi:VWFA-related protein
MIIYRILASLVLTCALAAAQSQTSMEPVQPQDPNQGMIIRINVNLVQLDGVATDSHGRPVADLKAEEVTVVQDGNEQQITNFTFVSAKNPRVLPVSGAKTVVSRTVVLPPSPKQLTQNQIRRVIALVVDDLAFSFESSVRTRLALKKWVDEQMQPGDMVALIQTGIGIGALQQFTNDKRILYTAIDRIKYNAAGRVGVDPLSKPSTYPPDANAAEELEFNLTLGSLGTLQYVLNGLKELPGRKSMILFSEVMRSNYRNDPSKNLTISYRLQGLIDAANRSSVVIHGIDPRGVVGYIGKMSGTSPEEITASMDALSQELTSGQDAVVQLAKQTGGIYASNNNSIDGMLEDAVEDGGGYYLIGYQPDASVIAEMQTGKMKYHNIKVRIKRPGVHWRMRSGFLGAPEDTVPSELRNPDERIAQLLYSPFAAGDVKLRLTAMFSQMKDDKYCITALLHFNARDLDFASQPDDWHEAVVNIIAATVDSYGDQMDVDNKKWTIRAKGKTFEKMQQEGISFLIHVPVKKAGPYQTRIVLWDTRSGRMGSASHYTEVPDVRKGRLALSGIALAGVLQKKDASEQAEGVMSSQDYKVTPAVRVFKPGSTIAWAYQILNPKTDGNRTSHIQTQIRLFHDGKEVYANQPSMILKEIPMNAKQMIVTGDMELVHASPGDYDLQIIVEDILAPDKQRVVAQSIDFEVE